jgi:hypothetical protein
LTQHDTHKTTLLSKALKAQKAVKAKYKIPSNNNPMPKSKKSLPGMKQNLNILRSQSSNIQNQNKLQKIQPA